MAWWRLRHWDQFSVWSRGSVGSGVAIGGIASPDPSLYLVDVEFREGAEKGAEKELTPAGSVAFLGPVDAASDYLTGLHALAGSDATPCDDDLIRDVDRIAARADDLSPQAERLKTELDVGEG